MEKIILKALLDGNIMSQKEFGQKCGVSAQTVSNWLNDVRNPGLMADMMSISRRLPRNFAG